MSERAGLRWGLPAAALACALGVAYAAYALAGWSWSQVVDYRSPYVADGVAQAGAGEPLADRVVLVIVDGLGRDASREMKSLQRLRAIGADYTLVAGQPSLSFPGWTRLLSGAPQHVSGVTTNWFDERVPVETLLDTVLAGGRKVGVVGPGGFETLYGIKRAQATYVADWEGTYLSAELVDQALHIKRDADPDLLIVHLPDVDETGHERGGGSDAYARMVGRVDGDLARLIEGTQSPRTAYAVVSDHGHIDSGGHGGWEPDVVRTPAVLAGAGVRYATGMADQSDLAPTLAVLLGIPAPRHAMGEPLTAVLTSSSDEVLRPTWRQRRAFAERYVQVIREPMVGQQPAESLAEDIRGNALDTWIAEAERAREEFDRRVRAPVGLAVAGGALAVLLAIGLASWRALVSALAGTGAYYAFYNAVYFLAHGHRWSLSAFNSESKVQAFFNTRMLEAALAGIAAAAVAALVYAALRASPRAPRGRYLPGWLALGPVTVLAVQATIALQVAWFLWLYGASVTWRLPNLMWGFKYDLDLVQATALGAAALAAPVVTWLVGRYHPRVRRAEAARASVLGGEREAAEESPRPAAS